MKKKEEKKNPPCRHLVIDLGPITLGMAKPSVEKGLCRISVSDYVYSAYWTTAWLQGTFER